MGQLIIYKKATHSTLQKTTIFPDWALYHILAVTHLNDSKNSLVFWRGGRFCRTNRLCIFAFSGMMVSIVLHAWILIYIVDMLECIWNLLNIVYNFFYITQPATWVQDES